MRYAIRQGALGQWEIVDLDTGTVRLAVAGRERAMLAASAMWRRSLDLQAAAAPPDGGTAFDAIVAFQDVESDDGRLFRNLQIRNMPLPLWCQFANLYGHDGAVIVGRFDAMAVDTDGLTVRGSGWYDGSEDAQRAIQQAKEKTNYGISMDATSNDYPAWECMEYDEERGWCSGRERTVYEGAIIVSATQVGTPAFAGAQISLDGPPQFTPARAEDAPTPPEGAGFNFFDMFWFSAEEPKAANAVAIGTGATTTSSQSIAIGTGSSQLRVVEEPPCDCEDLTAAAVQPPMDPPLEWFNIPEPAELTPLTLHDDGHLEGHIASWAGCHSGFPDACTLAPRSTSGYRYFHLHTVRTADGVDVPVGTLTMDTGHAGSGGAAAALAHYDNTGTGIADLHLRDGELGIWACGAARPGITEDQVRRLRASGASGDWRREWDAYGHDLGLELRALLSVPVPGFPIPRAELAASGSVDTLVAAGTPTLVAEAREPWRREVAALRREIAELRAATSGLMPLARARLRSGWGN